MFKNFWHGLARAFTIPRDIRNGVSAIAPGAKMAIADAAGIAAQQAIAARLTGSQAAAASAAVTIALKHAGLDE